jgi:hypothetical protein
MGQDEQELLRLLPKVLRARDFHLYLEGGKRLTDLWLAGGKAILGHKPPKVLHELKNAAERGLFTPLPHPMERRFLKALGELFPGRTFRLYMDSGSLQDALKQAGFTGPVPIWRPFLEQEMTSLQTDTIFIPVLPWPLGPEVLVLEESMDNLFPPGGIIPPVLLAPATRSLYDLAAKIRNPNRQRFHKIEKVLGEEKSLWRRQGIYLTVKTEMDKEKYTELFRCFLEGGFLIPPSPLEPAILPAVMSGGEETKLAQLLINFNLR